MYQPQLRADIALVFTSIGKSNGLFYRPRLPPLAAHLRRLAGLALRALRTQAAEARGQGAT